MKHYVLTRSAYGPEWTVDANRRRLEVTRAVTARCMAAQKTTDWAWIVLLHPTDPLMAERLAVFEAAAPEVIPILWTPDRLERVPWDRRTNAAVAATSLVAAAAYRAPWRSLMESGPVLQTRLDDDDGLHPTALRRYQRAARTLSERTVLMLPLGLRVYGSRFSVVNHRKNAMHTLYTPAGDPLCVYDYGHVKCHEVAPVKVVDRHWGWIWVRHQDTISGWRQVQHKLTDRVRGIFPVDWPVVEAAR